MAESLSPADRGSLAAERGPINMAVAGVMLAEAGPGLAYAAVCERIQERIHLMPRYRQRLEQPPLGVAHPVWVDDENFDVGWHVRATTLPAPGGASELAAYVGREASRRLDRSRPLWELHLVDGLEDGRVAVIPKMHHALVDGMAALGAVMLLLDFGPEPQPVEPPPEPWQPRPYTLQRHLRKIAMTPVRQATRLSAQATERLLDFSPTRPLEDARRATELITTLARARGAAPALPFNRPIGANRAFGFTEAPLAVVKDAGKAAGGTVNDAILAAVCGMLDAYLAEAGVKASELPRDPVALVPVSVRREEDQDAGGNHLSIVFVDLPVGAPDVSVRIALLNQRMSRIKSSAQVRAGALMVGLGGFAPPMMSSALARAASVTSSVGVTGDRSPFNLVVSNVPGPQIPLWLNGSLVHAAHPVVPLNPGDQGLNVGVLSYNGHVCFGISADRTLDPPVSVAVEALENELAALAVLAG